MPKKPNIYQDRLGTDTGRRTKAQLKTDTRVCVLACAGGRFRRAGDGAGNDLLPQDCHPGKAWPLGDQGMAQ